jgi:hypothetical protein
MVKIAAYKLNADDFFNGRYFNMAFTSVYFNKKMKKKVGTNFTSTYLLMGVFTSRKVGEKLL